MKRSDKAALWIKQAENHVTVQDRLRRVDPASYDQSLRSVKELLKPKGHFKQERVSKKKAMVASKASLNKVQNKLQKTQGVELTFGVLGLIPYGKLKKDRHLQDLRTELSFRGITFDDKKDGLRSLCSLLKKHEINRLKITAGGQHADKAFKALSGAVFAIEYDA